LVLQTVRKGSKNSGLQSCLLPIHSKEGKIGIGTAGTKVARKAMKREGKKPQYSGFDTMPSERKKNKGGRRKKREMGARTNQKYGLGRFPELTRGGGGETMTARQKKGNKDEEGVGDRHAATK